ncbi:GNAT family N-acetyltransferase [Cohnella caldifontis]|uniref:GNAT family N-acetyltransferase n=1 Tax=Cohnella caldifontis TaxID=3027471 RepID=UPI0023EC2CD7|nr:GNAT family N-acetyltransferase [Cohnella sp. YIM B05605]
MAEIRPLTMEDFEERMRLMQFAFQMPLTGEQIESRRALFRPEWDYGLFDDNGRLLSALLLIPFETWVQGSKLRMGGVAAVASWPDARRQGGVSKLLTHAFETMKRQGQSLSMLHPFYFPFYRKYGYEMTIERKHYTIPVKLLPPRAETAGAVRIVEKSPDLLAPVYETFASRYDGMLSRDDELWRQRALTKPGLAAAYFDEAGSAQGYMLYEVGDRVMKVHEWVAATEEARTALWSYAANHDSMIDDLKMTVPMDDDTAFLVPDPRFKQEIVPYFMSRIVDADAFVAQYAFQPSGGTDEVSLRLEDKHAPWNEGTYRLSIGADGTARLRRENGAGGGGEAACDIATLTAMLVGGRRPRFLRAVGRLQGSEAAVETLERRVPLQRPYLADFF